MNLNKLFEMQDELEQHIAEGKELQGKDLSDEKFVAIHVELGEMMNEQRSWKYWSADREPRVKVPTTAWGAPYKNPLLEEYVDVFHFLLSIGNDIGVTMDGYKIPEITKVKLEQQYLSLLHELVKLKRLIEFGVKRPFDTYRVVFMKFINLGKMLGFTWRQIEQAYFIKNKVNYERQQNGY